MTHWLRDVSAAVLALGLPASAWAGVCATDFDLGTQIGPSVSTGNTCGQGNQFGSNVPGYTVTCAGGSNTTDLSFLWTAPQSGTYQFDTNGSSYDTALQLRAEIDCGMTQLACDDDGGNGLQSLITYDLVAGEQIIIVVDGYSGTACGDYFLNISLTGCLDVDSDAICDDVDPCIGDNATGDSDGDGVCNDRDQCLGDDASGDGDVDGLCNDRDTSCDNYTDDLGTSYGPLVEVGNTCGGVNRFGSLVQTSTCGSGANSPDEGFLWTAPRTGTFVFTTFGSPYNTVMSVRSPVDCGTTEYICNDDVATGVRRSTVALDVTAGQQYLVVADGSGSANCGDYYMSILDPRERFLLIPSGTIRSGGSAIFEMAGVKPFSRVTVLGSRVGRTARTPYGSVPVDIRIDQPIVLTSATTNATGDARITVPIPTSVPSGTLVWLQAIWEDTATGTGAASNVFPMYVQ